MAWVQLAYEKSHRIYGYRRITLWLRKTKGILINSKSVLRLMHKLSIRSIARKCKVFKQISAAQLYHHYDNVRNRKFRANQPNQKWVTDITYIATQQGWAYLSIIKDLSDGFIVAHRLGRENSLGLVLNTLRQAKQKAKVTDGLLLHSDRGYQYTSQGYFVLTQEYRLPPSMSRPGNCWDKAPMENFFGHLKEEALRQLRRPTFEEAQQIIDEYVHFYNYERIQLRTRQTPYETRCLST
jgi:putative transposase